MAIKITKPTTILGGLTIEQLYLRFFYTVDFNGKGINVSVRKYLSREGYLGNQVSNTVMIPEIDEQYEFFYDRSVDGNDVLTFIHNKLKTLLSTPVTQTIQDRDPSTGKFLFDPSTGEPIMITNVIKAAFCNPEQIFFIDIDPE